MTATAVIPLFYLNLDFTGPEAPTNLKFHADSLDDPENRWDDDTEVWLSWDPSFDTQQEVLGYFIDISGMSRATQSYFIEEGISLNITLPGQGMFTASVYAVDESDNIGRATITSIIIDMGEIRIVDQSPTYLGGTWFMDTEVEVTFSIIDEVFASNGPELDLSTLQYKVTTEMTEAARDSVPWASTRGYRVISEHSMGSYTQYTLTAGIRVKEGKNNYIWFSALDEVGNIGQTETYDPQTGIDEAEAFLQEMTSWTEEQKSDFLDEATEKAYETAMSINPGKIWVDMTPVDFSSPSPSGDPLEEKRITATVQISDLGSWVDTSTIQYSVSRNGISNYGGWISVDPDIDDSEILARTVQPLLFEPGSTNYIRWRARDVAGNGYTVSDDYPIILVAEPVNNPPVSEIITPRMNDVYDTRQRIYFDGSSSSDPDQGDEITFSWVLGNRTVISTLSDFEIDAAELGPGPHVVSLYVSDGQWTVTSSISVYVKTHPDEVDTDGDGTPDGSDQDDDNDGLADDLELIMGTNPRLRDTDLDGKNDKLDPKPLNPLVVDEKKDEGNVSYYTILSLLLVLAALILLIGSLVVLRRRSSMEKDRIERAVIAEGRIVSRYEELTGVGAPLLPQVKEMGLPLPPVSAQHVAPMKRARELAETPSLPTGKYDDLEEPAPTQTPATTQTPAPEPDVPTPPAEKKPAPMRRIRRKTADTPASTTPGDIPSPGSLMGTAALPGSQDQEAAKTTTTCDLCGSSIDVPAGASTVECPLCGENKNL
jgi:hypothetical protein